jgi:hypothetical protein
MRRVSMFVRVVVGGDVGEVSKLCIRHCSYTVCRKRIGVRLGILQDVQAIYEAESYCGESPGKMTIAGTIFIPLQAPATRQSALICDET